MLPRGWRQQRGARAEVGVLALPGPARRPCRVGLVVPGLSLRRLGSARRAAAGAPSGALACAGGPPRPAANVQYTYSEAATCSAPARPPPPVSLALRLKRGACSSACTRQPFSGGARGKGGDLARNAESPSTAVTAQSRQSVATARRSHGTEQSRQNLPQKLHSPTSRSTVLSRQDHTVEREVGLWSTVTQGVTVLLSPTKSLLVFDGKTGATLWRALPPQDAAAVARLWAGAAAAGGLAAPGPQPSLWPNDGWVAGGSDLKMVGVALSQPITLFRQASFQRLRTSRSGRRPDRSLSMPAVAGEGGGGGRDCWDVIEFERLAWV